MHRKTLLLGALLLIPAAFAPRAWAQGQVDYPAPVEGDYVIRAFGFRSGETLPELRLHYRTIGEPRRDAQGIVRNAVLIMHGTTGTGAQFLSPSFAGELYGPGELLDATTHYIILTDAIGHGGSSKPSDGLHARFPKYGYHDMVTAQYRLLSEHLGVNHLRLVMGTSMGGMHSWMWGEMYPDFMDALMPLASLPGPISGRNRMWRKIMIDAVRTDPDWNGGDYAEQPSRAMHVISGLMDFMGGNPITHYRAHPTLESVDEAMAQSAERSIRSRDANDVMYAFAASEDYNPAPDLEKIQAPLLAINSADDLINPPELQILETEIKRVRNGRAIVIPLSDQTVGHGTHTRAAVWKNYLEELLAASDPSPKPQRLPS
jgi:homoserine O-acetyltransferase